VAEETLRQLQPGEIRLRVHGGQDERGGDEVPASVLAQKLTIRLRALRAADAAVNGKIKHEYLISGLKLGSAIAEVREEEIKNIRYSKANLRWMRSTTASMRYEREHGEGSAFQQGPDLCLSTR
jgi:hypothetical protein